MLLCKVTEFYIRLCGVCLWGWGVSSCPHPPPPDYINVSGLYSFTTLCGNIFSRLTVSPWRKLGKFSNFKPLSQKYIVYGYSLTVFTKTWEKQKQKQNPKGRIYLVTFIFRTWSSVVVHNRFFFSISRQYIERHRVSSYVINKVCTTCTKHVTFISPGHNQIWIYDDVTHICKMAPTPRNTREGHFLALCCA